ncbi:BCCT family transporter [Butyrivibrio sp. AE3009]|uniref:BCCT family transporter n=1 Tax=Butyrivibrio sp. AE3009 TaxID=1280666 RepID=UPI0003B2FF0D|nr:BCCT family transporter [Butyrivibrio sp. AE3009]
MNSKRKFDWLVFLIPLLLIAVVSACIFALPAASNSIISLLRYLVADTFGVFFLILGLFFFLLSIFLAFSRYGDIVLGNPDEKPKYSFFSWGSMMFTCGLAADIIVYSFSEWIMYSENPHISELGSMTDYAGVFPMFHWSFIPWSFYLVLAVIFGFMIHVKKRNRLRFSEACRPLLGNYSDKLPGKIIDIFSLFALIAGTATTFSIATPLLSGVIISFFGINISRNLFTIIILLITCVIYSYAILHGIKGVDLLAKCCIGFFFGLLIFVFVCNDQKRFIIENGFQSFGLMLQHFFEFATYTDPARTTMFPQDWTVYYWAYWMVWCIAAPFFIGNISRGRTIRQTILGGYLFGVGSTLVSFIILGNYSLGKQLMGQADFISTYRENNDIYETILSIISTMNFPSVVLIIIMISMILFYSTSFDAIAYTAACYSYEALEENAKPHWIVVLTWCIILITLPIALVFSGSTMSNIQSVSIITALPIGIIMLAMVAGFFKDAGTALKRSRK